MGYTHYWTTRESTPGEWLQMQAAAKKIISRARARGIAIAGYDGLRSPTVGEVIDLNGRGDESYESFLLTPLVDRDFCKTDRKPYDAVVVALLIVGARLGILSWSSDGDAEDHEAGIALAGDLP